MPNYIKTSFLDDFEIPEITTDNVKSVLLKVNTTHSVNKNVSYANLPVIEKLKVIQEEVYKVLGRYKGFVKVIDNYNDFDKYADMIIKNGYLALDTETNNSLDPLTCKLMGLCLYIPNTKPVYVPINHTYPETDTLLPNQVSEEDAAKVLKKVADAGVKIIYHNGKFDIRVINNTLGFYMPIWWDTMLAAQMLNENEQAKLKYQYKAHINPTIGSYNIEKLFSGVPYAYVDPKIFALYAAIDAYDTYKLQQYQNELLSQPDLNNLKNLFLNIEVPVTLVVSHMEDDGMSMNDEFIKRLDKKYHDELDSAIKNLYKVLEPYNNLITKYQENGKLDNPLNFNSSQQLPILMYDIMGIVPPIEGSRSADKDTLTLIDNDFTKALLTYRHYQKAISAFTDPLPKLRSKKDGKIHAHFNQMGAEDNNVRTGRFSCTNPNLQQIPSKGDGKEMRLMFCASNDNENVELDSNNTLHIKLYSEIETPDGWKYADKLVSGDIIYIYDNDTCLTRTIKNIIITDEIVLEIV